MRTVRLYIRQDTRVWSEEVPFSERFERQADLEMAGATIYHASLLTPIKTTHTIKPRTGEARHLFA